MSLWPRDHEVGNPEAASDLYGLGVRVGIYLQAFGTYFYILRSQAGGTKITNAGLMLAMLAPWSILVSQNSISPAEALVIHTVASVPGAPAVMACFASGVTIGEGTGILATFVAVAWRDFAMLAFWARLYRSLPMLGTANKTWFFAQVRIDGWFRVFSLVVTIFVVFNFFVYLPGLWKTMVFCVKGYWKGERPDDEASESLTGLKKIMFSASCVSLPFGLAIMIALAEMTINYNSLKPTTDITRPGQAIPLAVGIITFVDGLFVLVRPVEASETNAATRQYGGV
ncbi:hypothetical protein LIA77_08192 [Sarocladium implicatum]|nr:hypothetical protein LIA77_08192 [Sarocladium implicatum]